RDFYWYSPLLKERLGEVTGDLLVQPKSEAEVLRVLAECYSRDIPVTPRGAGTGNYGQAMPLAGGVVLDLAGMDRIVSLGDRAVVEPGVILHHLDQAARAEGRELRMHPSTAETATVGGFVGGGSAGVGSIRWGALADPGNLLRLKVATMEAEPRLVELTGPEVNWAHHAYGVNGIITEIELPLAPAPDWVDVLVGFDSWKEAVAAGWDISHQDGFLLRQVAAIQAPIPHDYFKRHQKFLRREQSLVVLMVARESMEPLVGHVGRLGGEVVYRADTATEAEAKGLPAAYLLCWNHTTLRALRVDPSITYLQVGYEGADPLAQIARIDALLGDETPGHIEFRRYRGGVLAAGLPLVRFRSAERLREVMAIHEAEGCPNYSPHHYTIEEGGMKAIDQAQLAFKRETDPKGLLNPGKMIGWEEPEFDFGSGRDYAFPGLQRAS
ncbi:MAG: FAD-binding oxidoreductase, partial [Pseudomonadota bacterium]